MSTAAVQQKLSYRLSLGPWLWSPAVDLAVFGGSAGFALALVVLGQVLGFGGGELGVWGFAALVIGIDVAHVWATLFRTYLDPEELRRSRARYVFAPLLAYAGGVLLYALSSLTFWRVLAYVAVFHFVRQQVGWVALYRAHAGRKQRVDRFIDEACVYTGALYPILYWHANLETSEFAWFVRGDFVDLGAIAGQALPFGFVVWLACIIAYPVRQIQLLVQSGRFELGKSVVVVATVSTWYVGIVLTNSDFNFTICNVITHGVPYFALLWAYARERRREVPETLGSTIAAGGVFAFLAGLLFLAFFEELAWDRLVWHDHSWLFGAGSELSEQALIFLVPLLALPQATHYILDGFLWRRSDTARSPAQRRALGFVTE